MTFLKLLINGVEEKIRSKYVSGAIEYIDQNHDEAWSKAIDRFELALATLRRELIYVEAGIYLDTIVYLLSTYQEKDKQGELEDFLSSLLTKSPQ